MSKITLFKCFLILIIFPIFILNCSKDNNNEVEIINNNSDSALVDLFTDISNNYNTVLEIAPIPIFDDLTNLNNEYVDQILESISKFNDLLKNPQDIPESIEKSSKLFLDYDTCVTSGNYTECTYFRDKGAYSITVKQEISPTYYTYKVYFSGIFEGVDYGSMYLLQDQFMGFEGISFYWNFYRPPSPPEFANQKSLSITYLIQDDETTIYTPWGAVGSRASYLNITFYVWDYILDDNRPSSCNEMILDGNILNLKIWTWSYNKEELFCFWIANWDFESKTGTWASFDENGIPQNSGPM